MYPPRRTDAFDRQFNAAINRIASLILPTGFDVSPSDPFPTEAELFAHLDRPHARMKVWGGASNQTIYGDAETNHAFRAWHDWTHWKLRAPFTLMGERAVYHQQYADLASVYPGHDRLPHWRKLLHSQIVGQALYKEAHGAFPTDERRFTRADYPGAARYMIAGVSVGGAHTVDAHLLPHHIPGG